MMVLADFTTDQQKLWQNVALSMGGTFFTTDSQGRFTSFYGHWLTEELGSPLHRTPVNLFGVAGEALTTAFARALKGESINLVWYWPAPEGITVPYEVMLYPLFPDVDDKDKPPYQPIGLVGIARRGIQRSKLAQTVSFITQANDMAGDAFLAELVGFLGRLLEVDYVLIGRLLPKGTAVRTAAFWAQGETQANFIYELAGTPCAGVLGQNFCLHPNNVAQLFPQDQMLTDLNIAAYAGLPLWDSNNNPLGIIALMSQKPITTPDIVAPILQVVASRVTAMLAEKNYLDHIHFQRDLVLALANSNALDTIFDALMDSLQAITEVDSGILYTADPVTRGFQLQQAQGVSERFLQGQEMIAGADVQPHSVYYQYADLVDSGHLDLSAEDVRAQAQLPIFYNQRQVALLNVFSHQQDFWGRGTRYLLETTAAYIGGTVARIQAHEQLRVEKERYRSLVSSLGEGIVFHSPDGSIVTCNESAERILGLSHDQMIGRTPIDPHWRAIHLDGSPFPGEDHPASVTQRTGEPQSGVIMGVQKPDDSLTWISVNSQPICQPQDTPPYAVVASFTDITEQVLSDQRVRLLSKAVDQSPTAVVIIDQQGIIQYINQAFASMAQRKQSTLLSQPANILFRENDPTDYRKMWREVTRGRTWHGEFLYRHANGDLRWKMGTLAPIRNLQGKIEHVLGIAEDITEIRHLQEMLRQRNEELQHLNEVGFALGSSLDMKNVVETLVQETQQLLSVTAVSLWLQPADVDHLVCTQASIDIAPQLVGKQIAPGQGLTGQAWHDQAQHTSHQFHDKPFAIEKKWLRDRHFRSAIAIPIQTSKQTIGVLTCFDERPYYFQRHRNQLAHTVSAMAAAALENASLHQDIQQQLEMLREAQNRLVQNEKLAALGQLIAGVAHELNNPLSSVILQAELLELRFRNETTLGKKLNRVAQDAHRAASIVQRLLDFARQRPPERKAVQLNELTTATLDLIGYSLETRNIEIVTDLQPDLPLVMADPQQVQQVLINLVTNAQQAMLTHNESGRVRISTRHTAVDEAEKDAIEITISDNGPGIPPQLQSRIFDPFFTTKDVGEGTGLGLAVCHGIITEHGGTITLRSAVNQGTIFIVRLPIGSPQEAQEAFPLSTSQPPLPQGKAQRILIMDDEDNLRHVIANILELNGYDVTAVDNGYAGLQQLQESSFDLILCDINMPDMGGQEFYEALQAQVELASFSSRLMFITGDVLHKTTRSFIEEIGASCLHKPFDIAELLQAVQRKIEQ